MTTLHPDSDAIDRVGIRAITDNLGVTRQAVHYWRKQGVPNDWRDRLHRLGQELKTPVPEMKNSRDRRRGRPTTSGKSPTSPASPA